MVHSERAPGLSPFDWAPPRVRVQSLRRVREAVAKLPRDYGRILTLYDLELRTIDKVAPTVGRTADAISMLGPRASDFLRETYGSESQI